MMMLDFGSGISGFLESLIMIIAMSLPMILLVWISFYLFDRINSRNKPDHNYNPALSLKAQLARGEISINEYRKFKQMINVRKDKQQKVVKPDKPAKQTMKQKKSMSTLGQKSGSSKSLLMNKNSKSMF